jgi:TolB protein
MLMNRRTFTAATGLGLAMASAQAQFRVEISGVGATQIPIAIPRFRDEDKVPHAVSAIIRADLERIGVFRGIDTVALLDETSQPNMAEWRSKTADLLVGGSVMRLADGRFDLRAKLWDVVRNKELGGQAFVVAPGDLRVGAHRLADYIYELVTGEKGVFATRIAFVDRKGRNHVLRVADSDGENAQLLIGSNDPIISPAWSPLGKELAFVSFQERQKAVVYAQVVATGARREIAAFRGSNSAPAWSPDGGSLAVTLTRDGGSQLYIIGSNGENPRRITNSPSIDTEAVFTPDGKSLLFVSDRGGGPQIYRTSVSGGPATRVSFTGNYNISPAISPDGRYLAYISRQGGAFRVYLADLSNPDPSSARALTDSSDDESPSFAPNGRLILYATRSQGRDVLMTTTLDGKVKSKLASTTGDYREPVWGPFGR